MVTFLVDGRLENDVRALMESVGDITMGSWNSNRSSYMAQLRQARATRARLVWFAEDDYFYSRGSLSALAEAVRRFPDVDWFALTGPTPLQLLELRRAQSAVPLPAAAGWSTPETGHHGWRRIDSTTSTFGGRPRAIRRVAWLLRLCPWSGAAWDRTTCLAIQGALPYPWRYVFADLFPPSTPRRWLPLRLVWRVASRCAVNLASLTQRPRPSALIAPVVPLIAHMELPYEERPEVWDGRAKEFLHEDLR